MELKIKLSRRQHIKHWLAIASTATGTTQATESGADVLYSGGSYRSTGRTEQQFGVVKYTPHRQERSLIESSFFPHAFCVSPTNRHHVLAFEKIGPGAALFDLHTAKMLKPIGARAGKLFYGHGVYSPDGNFFYCTESSVDGSSGSIGVYDAHNFIAVGELPSHGIRPHDLQLSKDAKSLLVTNGGGSIGSQEHGSLCWIDLRSGRLQRKLIVDDDRFNAGHLQVNGELSVVVSAPRSGLAASDIGGIQVNLPGQTSQKLAHLNAPTHLTQGLSGESLSVLVVPERSRFYVTHPTPGLVTRWNATTLALEQIIELPKARGLALSQDRKTIFVSFDVQAKLATVLLNDGKDRVQQQVFDDTLLAGSHLFNWPQR
jgi:uncharacterized protein